MGICFMYMKPDSAVGTRDGYKHNGGFPRNFMDVLLGLLENKQDAQQWQVEILPWSWGKEFRSQKMLFLVLDIKADSLREREMKTSAGKLTVTKAEV